MTIVRQARFGAGAATLAGGVRLRAGRLSGDRQAKGRVEPVGTAMLAFVVVGIVVGVFSGLVGIGGGILLVPILVFAFGLSQHQAQGTTLALLVPPIGLLGAFTYYKQGYVDIKVALLVAAGFFIGSLLGAHLSVGLPDKALARVFGGAVLLIGAKMLIGA
jgi:uncharacterized protein